MGSTISSIPKRVYYVLTYVGLFSGATIYVGANSTPKLGWGDSYSTRKPSDAKQFGSVSAAIAFARETARVRTDQSLDLSINVVRVEETAGTEQRVVLGETQGAPLGAKVKYMIVGTSGGNNGRVGIGGTIQWNQSLDAATLFASQEEAISAVKVHPYGGSFNIVRVAVVAGTPTLTETVLS